jgi:hypothetical protein
MHPKNPCKTGEAKIDSGCFFSVRNGCPRWVRAAGAIAMAAMLSAGSCVGPAELSSGPPGKFRVDADEGLMGNWISVDADAYLNVVLTFGPAEDGALGVVWTYLGLPGHCFTVLARPFDVDGIRYYDGTWYDPKEEDKEFLSCERYTPEGEEPGHVIVKAAIDAAGHLYLRFLRNTTLLRFQELGQLDARIIETAKDKLVDEYLLVDISSDDVVALLRGTSEEGLFSDPVGPFIPLRPDLPPIRNSTDLSGDLR